MRVSSPVIICERVSIKYFSFSARGPCGSGQPSLHTREGDTVRIQMRRKHKEESGARHGQISGQGIKAIFTNTEPTTGGRNIIDCAETSTPAKSSRKTRLKEYNILRHLFGILAVGVNLAYTLIPGQATDGKDHHRKKLENP